jgi:CheY-like chemotaxis protein
MIKRLIGENMQIELVLATDLNNVWADPVQIDQVLMNLATNARDAMPHGGTLTIKTTNVTVEDYAKRKATLKAGHYVVIIVTDTGCGMNEATQQRVFEPFFTTKDVGNGTGLGLSTVYGIVNQHNGYIWVNSQTWGTDFTMYLPSTDAEVEELPQEAEEEDMPKGSEVILVAENEPAVRKLVGQVLEQLGYTVLSASHAQEAEELLMKHSGKIDLLLSDVMMPGQSGTALYERLKVKRPSLKVLYMSGHAETALDIASCTSFLSKPFTHETLAEKVREVLNCKDAEGVK